MKRTDGCLDAASMPPSPPKSFLMGDELVSTGIDRQADNATDDHR